MTKVLMITNRFIYGGIEKLLIDIFTRKKDTSIQYELLTLISEKDEDLIRQLKTCNVPYYSLELDKHSAIERQIFHYRSLYRFLVENKYDVVHINITSYARVFDMLVVKLAGVKKRIIHSHSADKYPLIWRMISLIRKLYDYTATHYLACSDSAAKHLFSRKIYNSKRYIIVKNGIDLSKYIYSQTNRKNIRKLLNIPEDTLVIGHVGRFTRAKNHDFLLEVFGEIQRLNANTRLLLVGDGELKSEIDAKIASLKIEDKVILYGSSPDVSVLLSAMDVFVFPSSYEGFGLSAIEAEANGLPCYISENVPKQAEITSNVHQFSTSEGAEWWAKRILQEEHCRVDETDKLKQAVYDIETTVMQLEKIYTEGVV